MLLRQSGIHNNPVNDHTFRNKAERHAVSLRNETGLYNSEYSVNVWITFWTTLWKEWALPWTISAKPITSKRKRVEDKTERTEFVYSKHTQTEFFGTVFLFQFPMPFCGKKSICFVMGILFLCCKYVFQFCWSEYWRKLLHHFLFHNVTPIFSDVSSFLQISSIPYLYPYSSQKRAHSFLTIPHRQSNIQYCNRVHNEL
jgi:hypothetical protein